ncbi:aminotransferase class IV family protein [Pseudoalteromonas luteoviolacea]|uniref:Aminotransferase class IV n=1 Tax=Pseudoalteromonas luteoviolacea NCIMB 1942 TaxID=1365253 RepID=A0A167HB40_9GAMM|nr:aminotransferase class IV family protein [Pseudoalteromonas luteoviolacea]KZN57924.1 hypothetical protein N482_23105 [Pseudoalteromonas luteoviolacea NCIMB 1942]
MNTPTSHTHLLLNGQTITDSETSSLAFGGFAHFTSIQIRNKQIKGLDLHLERLKQASQKLYGYALSNDTVQNYIRSAIEQGPEDQSLTITMFSPNGEFTASSMNITPSVLIKSSAPEQGPSGPLTLSVINHERPLAEIKHVGEIGKTYYLHQAIKRGFDDAVFMNNAGHLSEGTIWNLAFWDGETVIWPKALMLQGTMMSIVQRQLSNLNIPQRHEYITLARLSDLKGAAVMNSWTPGVCVSKINSTFLPDSKQLTTLLHKAYNKEPAKKL